MQSLFIRSEKKENPSCVILFGLLFYFILFYFNMMNWARTLLTGLSLDFSILLPMGLESRSANGRKGDHNLEKVAICQILSLCESEYFSRFQWSGVDLC